MDVNYKNLLPIVLEACDRACAEIMTVYNSPDFEAQWKEDNSPLTSADRKSHAVIDAYLLTTDIPIISEEGQQTPYEERREWPYFWLVDPLDGTKEFMKRNGEFTVNIALVKGTGPVLGVVALPVNGDVYYGIAGEGAFVRSGGKVSELSKRQVVDLDQEGLRVVASRSHMNPQTQAYIDQLNNPKLVSKGSSLKFIAMATGEADLYPRFTPCMEWDTAAADAILREVGLSIQDITTSQPLAYNKHNLLTNYFVCGNISFP